MKKLTLILLFLPLLSVGQNLAGYYDLSFGGPYRYLELKHDSTFMFHFQSVLHSYDRPGAWTFNDDTLILNYYQIKDIKVKWVDTTNYPRTVKMLITSIGLLKIRYEKGKIVGLIGPSLLKWIEYDSRGLLTKEWPKVKIDEVKNPSVYEIIDKETFILTHYDYGAVKSIGHLKKGKRAPSKRNLKNLEYFEFKNLDYINHIEYSSG